MKKIYAFLFAALLLIMSQPARAIITDPDDYLIYDSGGLGDSLVANNFDFNNTGGAIRFITTDSVRVEVIGYVGTTVGARTGTLIQDLVDMGFPPSVDYDAIKGVTKLWSIAIAQDNNNLSGNGPYKIDAIEYKKMQRRNDPLLQVRWDYNKPEGRYSRPSDSIIVRIPAYADSIVIVGLGAIAYSSYKSTYALMAYQKDKGRDAHYHAGDNWGGFVGRIGIKPEPAEGQDSVDIVLLAPHKDWYTNYTNPEWSSPIRGRTVYALEKQADGVSPLYIKGERWGLFEKTNIFRIKVFGDIEKGEVPPFEGVISGWTFNYRPKTTGTVDLADILKQASGWGGQSYYKYASDLGVVRAMLTASKGYQLGYDDDLAVFGTRLTGLPATDDTTDFTVADQHPEGYYDLAFSAKGFQDMTLDLDFALRGGSDTLMVLAKLVNDKEWTVLGAFNNAENPISQLGHVSCPLPAAFADKADINIRLLQGRGAVGESAELVLTNLKIKGYDDYVALNEGARKVAYITPAADRLHLLGRSATADSSDQVLRALMQDKDVDVTAVTRDVWEGIGDVAEALSAYDVIVVSPYLEAQASIVSQLASLVGRKPILSLNAAAFASWTQSVAGAAAGTALTADGTLRMHPVFANLTLADAGDDFSLPVLSDETLQSFTTPATAASYVLGAAGDKTCFYEDYSQAAKLICLGLTPAAAGTLNADAKTLIANTLGYLSNSSAFVAPDFVIDGEGRAIVATADELRAALAYDFAPLNLSESVILLKGGQYNMSGATYGQGKITLQPYDDQPVTIVGHLSPANQLDMTSLTFKNLTFTTDVEQPLMAVTAPKSSVSDGIYWEGCRIDGYPTLLQVAGDSICLQTASVGKCRLNSPRSNRAYVDYGTQPMAVACIVFDENVFDTFLGRSLVDWNTPAYALPVEEGKEEPVIRLELTHNSFFEIGVGSCVNMLARPTHDSVYVEIGNNLFVNMSALEELVSAPQVRLASDSVVCLRSEHNVLCLFEPYELIYDALVRDELRQDFDHAGIGLSTDELATIETQKTISKLSPLFTAGKNRSYVGSILSYAERTEPMVMAVHNVPEFKTALDVAIGGDVIELYSQQPYDEADTLRYGQYGVYALGLGGFSYPATGGRLTIRAAEGQHPVLFGRITPNNNARLDALVIDGLTFADQAGFPNFDDENAGPFYFTSAADIGQFRVVHCTFENLQNQRLFRTNACAGLYLGEVHFDFNRFENHGGTMADGQVGAAHFFQLADRSDYTLSRFVFTENIVSNFHGSQLFNLSRTGSQRDSSIVIDISHNLFYKLGGNAKDQYRNFLDFSKTPVGCTVDINISDNLFYKRWSDVNKPICQLALYDTAGVKSSHIVLARNYYEGDYYPAGQANTFGANPVSNSVAEDAVLCNLIQTSGDVVVERDAPLTWEELGIEDGVFTDEEALLISQQSPLYTAGTQGSAIGPRICYGIADVLPAVQTAAAAEVFARQGSLWIRSRQSDQLQVFTLSGQAVINTRIPAGTSRIDNLPAGLYVVRIGGSAAKVVLR